MDSNPDECLDACVIPVQNQNEVPRNGNETKLEHLLRSNKLDDRSGGYQILSKCCAHLDGNVADAFADAALSETTVRCQSECLRALKCVVDNEPSRGSAWTKIFRDVCVHYACSPHSQIRADLLQLICTTHTEPSEFLEPVALQLCSKVEKSAGKGQILRQLTGILELINASGSNREACNYDNLISAIGSVLAIFSLDRRLRGACYDFLKEALLVSKCHSIDSLDISAAQRNELRSRCAPAVCDAPPLKRTLRPLETRSTTASPSNTSDCAQFGKSWIALVDSGSKWQDRRDAILRLNDAVSKGFSASSEILLCLSRVVGGPVILPVFCAACVSVKLLAVQFSPVLLRDLVCALLVKLREKTTAVNRTAADTLSGVVGQVKSVFVDSRLIEGELKHMVNGARKDLCFVINLLLPHLGHSNRVHALSSLVGPCFDDGSCAVRDAALDIAKVMIADASTHDVAHLAEVMRVVQASVSGLSSARQKILHLALGFEPKLHCSAAGVALQVSVDADSKAKREMSNDGKSLKAQLESVLASPEIVEAMMDASKPGSLQIWRTAIETDACNWRWISDILLKWVVYLLTTNFRSDNLWESTLSLLELIFAKSSLSEFEVRIVTPALLLHGKLARCRVVLVGLIKSDHARTVISLLCNIAAETKKKSIIQDLLTLVSECLKSGCALPVKSKKEICKFLLSSLGDRVLQSTASILLGHAVANSDMHTILGGMLKGGTELVPESVREQVRAALGRPESSAVRQSAYPVLPIEALPLPIRFGQSSVEMNRSGSRSPAMILTPRVGSHRPFVAPRAPPVGTSDDSALIAQCLSWGSSLTDANPTELCRFLTCHIPPVLRTGSDSRSRQAVLALLQSASRHSQLWKSISIPSLRDFVRVLFLAVDSKELKSDEPEIWTDVNLSLVHALSNAERLVAYGALLGAEPVHLAVKCVEKLNRAKTEGGDSAPLLLLLQQHVRDRLNDSSVLRDPVVRACLKGVRSLEPPPLTESPQERLVWKTLTKLHGAVKTGAMFATKLDSGRNS